VTILAIAAALLLAADPAPAAPAKPKPTAAKAPVMASSGDLAIQLNVRPT